MLTEYQKKLQHPKWQKRRYPILVRDNWTCQECGETEVQLHVHHKKYIRGKDPWDYPDEDLITLCKDCHEDEKKKVSIKLKPRHVKMMNKFLAGFSFTTVDGVFIEDLKQEEQLPYRIEDLINSWTQRNLIDKNVKSPSLFDIGYILEQFIKRNNFSKFSYSEMENFLYLLQHKNYDNFFGILKTALKCFTIPYEKYREWENCDPDELEKFVYNYRESKWEDLLTKIQK